MKKIFQSTADKVVKKQEFAESSKKAPFKYRTSAKVTAFVMTIVMLVVLIASLFGAYLMLGMNVYSKPKEEIRSEMYTSAANTISIDMVNYLVNDQKQAAASYCQYRNITGIFVDAKGKNAFQWHWGNEDKSGDNFVHNIILYWDGEYSVSTYDHYSEYDPVVVKVYIPYKLTMPDDLYMQNIILNLAYTFRYWIYIIGLAALAIGIFSFVILMESVGHRPYDEKVQPGWGTWIPIDLLAAGFFLASFLCFQFAVESIYYDLSFMSALMIAASIVAISIMGIGVCMSFAVRVKLGEWWKNSVLYYALCIAWKILKELGKVLRKLSILLVKIPLIWKTAAGFIGLSFVEFIVIMITWWESDNYFVFWILEKIVLFPVILYIALMLKKLQKAGKAIAAGDLSYQVDTEHMLPDFKAHGENLNQIGVGMTVAVEHRLKSERMKTELITNVSHDIKTPLTSIINYSDLIGKEPCDNPKITEYADVLHRQSERLKRLIEDLVEASKASTGNLEVLLAPCEVGVMMTQAIGEYEQRLENSQLTLMTAQPEEPVRIMADGRRLWRVFDNLMNNICKYGQPGTRVYFTLEATAEEAVIAFKNTSRDPLNLSSEELMERFVRGDSSRNSEGNGLGLSIAKSLTELQKGSMELTVDGDLFKVILRFPRIP